MRKGAIEEGEGKTELRDGNAIDLLFLSCKSVGIEDGSSGNSNAWF